MATKFAKFVEWATDSKYIPLGSRCSLCDKKLGFFRTGFWSINDRAMADGVLCAKCKARVERLLATKREWMKTTVLQKSSWNLFNINNMHKMPLQTAKEMIAAKESVDQRCLAAFGNDKTSLFRIEDAIRIEPTAIQVGVARAKRLKNKVVVFGTVERGSFSKNDQVQIQQDDGTDSAAILEAYVYDCDENTLEICLRANMGKHQLHAGERGWLVLDYEQALAEGSYIAG
jgi:hypothetical protein